MTFADVGVLIEHFACEITEAQMVVTLRRIHRNLAGLEFVTLRILDDFWVVQERDEMYTKLTIRILARESIE